MHYAIVALLVVCALLGWDDHSNRAKVEKLNADIGTYTAQVAELSGTIKTKDHDIELTNAAIDGLKKTGEQREQKAEQARKAAEIAAQSNVKLADALLQKQANPGKTDCENAGDLVNEYLTKRKELREKANTTAGVKLSLLYTDRLSSNSTTNRN